MRVLVAGAGAVGGLYAARLWQQGAQVVLAVKPQQAGGPPVPVRVASEEWGDFDAVLPRVPITAPPGRYDICIVALKYEQLAAAQLAMATADTVLPLCNALGAWERLRAWHPHVLVGHTSVQVERADGVVRHYGRHTVYVGEPPGGTGTARPLAKALRLGGINAEANRDGMTKLVLRGAVFTPLAALTAVYQEPIGVVLKDSGGKELAARLHLEYEALALVLCNRATAAMAEFQLGRTPRRLRSSLARDVAAGTAPELEGKLGYVLQLAKDYGIEMPSYRRVYNALLAGEVWQLDQPRLV